MTLVDVGFCLQSNGCAVLDGGAEDVAGGDSGDVQLFAQDIGLCAFSGAGGA